jgi:hypothetical protein
MPNRKKGRPNWSPLLLTERSKFSTPIAKMLMGDAAGCARSIRLHVDVVGVARDVIGGERTGSAIDYFNSAMWSGRCFPQTPGFRLVRPFVRCRLVPQRLCCRFESSRRRRCAIQRLEKTSPKGQEFVGDHRRQKAVFHERGRVCLNHLIDVFSAAIHCTTVAPFQVFRLTCHADAGQRRLGAGLPEG